MFSEHIQTLISNDKGPSRAQPVDAFFMVFLGSLKYTILGRLFSTAPSGASSAFLCRGRNTSKCSRKRNKKTDPVAAETF